MRIMSLRASTGSSRRPPSGTASFIPPSAATISVEFAYSFGGELATVAETLKSVQGGDDGATGATGDDAVAGFV
ncbi:hypothetical protein LCGC14_2332350, partial [marine sediment metagenome]